MVESRGTFEVEYVARDVKWVNEVVSHAEAARRAVSREMRDLFLVRIRVLIAPDKEGFLALVGRWAENSVAVAMPGPLFVINADALRTGSRDSLNTTLIHEMSHAYVGVRCVRRLPRWMDEGIAMAVAQEGSLEDTSAVFMANALNRLIPLRELEFFFPVQADRQRLAYRQSNSVVGFIARSIPGGETADLVAMLAGETGATEIARYWNPIYRNALEEKWRGSLRSRFGWLIIGFSSGVLWAIITLLFLLAWLVRRFRSYRQHREWAEEEQVYSALDEEESRVWGGTTNADDGYEDGDYDGDDAYAEEYDGEYGDDDDNYEDEPPHRSRP